MRQSESNMLPEYSERLIVDGDIVKVTLNPQGSNFRFPSLIASEKRWFVGLANMDIHWNIPRGSDARFLEDEEALILVDWIDDQRQHKRRFVLMLLKWVGDRRAERVGLLNEHRDEIGADTVAKLERRRMTFELV